MLNIHHRIQFIYDSVADSCVEVATHRHGCCVLQRCIDHASDTQKRQLVDQITCNSLALVQVCCGFIQMSDRVSNIVSFL